MKKYTCIHSSLQKKCQVPSSFACPELRCSRRPERRSRAALGGPGVGWPCPARAARDTGGKKKKKKCQKDIPETNEMGEQHRVVRNRSEIMYRNDTF
jgi:hypothetical protein